MVSILVGIELNERRIGKPLVAYRSANRRT